MLKNYFKIALRNLWRNKVYSLVNVSGLSIGITTCLFILLYVTDELSYDTHHPDGDRIYRIASQVKNEEIFVAASAPIAGGLKKDYTEVEQVTRLLRFPGLDKILLKNETSQKQFYETNGYYIDSTFFQIFSYQFKFGDITTALNQPNSLIISEEIATKFFGNENPVDKVLKVFLPFGENTYTIKGVFQHTGQKSHIPAHFFLSMNNSDIGQWVNGQTNWALNNIFHTYIKLKKGTNLKKFEAKLPSFLDRNGAADFKAAGFSKTLSLQLMPSIYLHSNYGYEIAPNGNILYLYIFTSIAVFLLLIACVNFMNLNTARSEKRAKEIGVRKAIGAVKRMLIAQFMGEALLMSMLALSVSFILVQGLMPFFNDLTHKQLSFIDKPLFIFWLTLLTLVAGFLSGLYPAFYLSSFNPIAALNGKPNPRNAAVLIRKGLVVFQFTTSIVLILGAIIIGQQMHFLSNQNLGFEKNQKLILPIQSRESAEHYTALKNELAGKSEVKSLTLSSTYPGVENIQDMLFYAEGKTNNENIDIQTAYVGNDYFKTLEIPLLQGRGFAKEFTADSNAIVLNEVAVAQLGYTIRDAVGRKIYFEYQNKKYTLNIIGVAKNYHFQSLHQPIKPLGLTANPFFSSPNSYLILNINSKNYSKVIAEFEKIWKKINPNTPFEYSFLDQDFQKNYQQEERTAQLIRSFALIGIFIACLGLFGLATYTTEQRTKEIGIRKVLGASVMQIITLLSKDFLTLVLIAFVIAIPLAWFAMHHWLQNFAYRIDISWWIFALAGVLALMIALLTISFQAIKAALENPVKSLRTE